MGLLYSRKLFQKKLVKFSRLWEECSQEESRIAAREEKMGSEYQALIVQSKKSRSNHHRSTLIKRITLESLEICLSTFAIHVMKEDILLETVLKIKVALTRRRETREDIMLML